MYKTLSYILFLIWLCYLIISSVILFTGGFLLSRKVQKNNATCYSLKDTCEIGDETCSLNDNSVTDYIGVSNVCLPPRAKVILLIVDALRYDFLEFNQSIKNPKPFQNKLPVMTQLYDGFPNKTRLYKFIADPPTTTMQRLKALTTGSLPTFIDAGSNFATAEINEDNLIDQLVKNNYNIVFAGDDTWNRLYPKRFMRNFPYPSFNVWDLDTVDNGVRDTLYPELQNADWNIFIGHFLGVDHCGHRYGPDHPEMERKLKEINEVVQRVVKHIDEQDENVMLIVIGDHGMTRTGDHGGESPEEVTAGFFMYSKQDLLDFESIDSFKQVDLVPTLSTILGIPIPFQNLGQIVLNCIPLSNSTRSIENWQLALHSVWSNVQQMLHYVKEYSKNEKSFDEENLEKFYRQYSDLHNKLSLVVDENTFNAFHKEANTYMGNLRKMCEEVWVQFEFFNMARGLLFLFLSIFFVFIITDGVPINRQPEIFKSSFVYISYSVMLLATLAAIGWYSLDYTNDLISAIFFSTGLCSQAMLGMLIIQNWEVICVNWHSRSQKDKFINFFCRFILLFNVSGVFSNSYIIEESFVLLYLLISTIFIIAFSVNPFSTSPSKRKSTDNKFRWSKLKYLAAAVIISLALKSSMYFWKCREEQQWCFANPHDIGFITTKTDTTKLQWATTLIFLSIFVFAVKEWLKNCGNLNGFSVTVILSKFLPYLTVISIAGFWVIKNAQTSSNYPTPLKPLNILAWSAYSFVTLGISSCIIWPLMTYIIPSETSIQSNTNVIHNLFKKVKTSLGEYEQENDNIPVICGLGTVYSSIYIIIGSYLTLLFSLLLGEAMGSSAVIMFGSAYFIALLSSIFRIQKATSLDDLFDVPNITIVVWILLSQYFFYGSGHQPTFPNISWEAAFIGISGDFSSNFLPGTLIILNTFCSFILMGVMLPLLLITPFTIFVMSPSIVGKKTELLAASARGEVILFERHHITLSSLMTLSCKYVLGHGIRVSVSDPATGRFSWQIEFEKITQVFASMLAATIHCRHLMAWNIFAPKLIFESIGIMITLGSVLVGYLILVRINKKVEDLIITLNKMN